MNTKDEIKQEILEGKVALATTELQLHEVITIANELKIQKIELERALELMELQLLVEDL